ncbi:MAG: hypothetical protein O2931_18250, partial [Planctomycetota bacterium]|nr:hypothetical protein [Planctomycetota bacterium]
GTTRVWIVVQSSRGGLEEPIRRWLGTHCSHEAKLLRKRYDYAEYAVDVYLYSPAATHDGNADSAN